MVDSASELESDCSSFDGSNLRTFIPASKEQLQKRIDSLNQEGKVLKTELDTYKLKCRKLIEENKLLKKASVTIQAKAEQEEEYISNMLLKKIQSLKKEKESLAVNYEQEEEFLTNDLTRKLTQLKYEKVELEKTLEHEQELQVNKLLKKIRKLEAETSSKQAGLEQLRREKIELENTLEQEQEALVNKLWKRMQKLEEEKRMLQSQLDHPISENIPNHLLCEKKETSHLSQHVQQLKSEIATLKKQLLITQKNHVEKTKLENSLKQQNHAIQNKCIESQSIKHILSESESSFDGDDENRHTQTGVRTAIKLASNFTYNSTPNSNISSLKFLDNKIMALFPHGMCPECGYPKNKK